MDNKINEIDTMFKYNGKAAKLIGPQRLKAYKSAYNHKRISND